MNALADNDVILKGACYGLLPELLSSICRPTDPVGVLGAARFVVPKRIQRVTLKKGAEAAIANLQGFLNRAVTIEPTLAEQSLAGEFELAALHSGVSLDAGEGQLCAVLISRLVPLLLTGDKRAIRAIEQLLDSEDRLTLLRGKIKCLEQLVLGAMSGNAPESLRENICAETHIDKTLTICFECGVEAGGDHSEGLRSYIADLRRQAPRVLSA